MRLTQRALLSAAAIAVMAVLMPLETAVSSDAEDLEMLHQLELFAEAFSIARDNYVEDVTDADLLEGAINGALESLDPHSSYTPKEDYADRQKSARKEYGGLGIEVTLEVGLVKINYVTPNGPADKQGIKKGDFITAVEGERVLGKTLDDAVEGMRGLAGDPINVTVLSPDNSSRDITVIRETVYGRAVRHRVEDGVGYVYIETFNHPNLEDDVKVALDDLKESFGGTLPGLIVDVRSNPGGRVDQVVKVTSYFLDNGEVFSSRGREAADTRRYHAKAGELFPNVPIVVMINSQSASAAEIIAGALQDRNRALVLGRRSFGKGSVQSIMQLKNGGALRMTTERYYTPSGKSIQGLGIMPDVLVSSSPESDSTRKRIRESDLQNALMNPNEPLIEENLDELDYPPEDWETDEDYQLKKAVELVKSPRYRSMVAMKNTSR